MEWHTYRADMRIKKIDFGKRVRSHCSYLANTVELCFYNTLDFFLTRLVHLFLNTLAYLVHLAHFVTCVCQLLNRENGVRKVYY